MDSANMLDFAQDALKAAQLPRLEQAVGAKFFFGDIYHFVAGTIISVGYGMGDEGVSLRVSAPRLRGKDIKHLRHKGGGRWAAISPQGEETLGMFKLL
jgi:hypothetical protein